MSIRFEESRRVFSLETENTLYQMRADETGVLVHLFYGRKTDTDMSYLVRGGDRGFSGNPYEMRGHRNYSLDQLPQEYSCRGAGDYRISAFETVAENGSRTSELRYRGYEVIRGGAAPAGLPHVRPDKDTETLAIKLEDTALNLEVTLCYTVFPEHDAIVRRTSIANKGDRKVFLEKAASACVDFLYGDYEMMHFHGRHCMERLPERLKVPRGVLTSGSRRGMSSHQNNPFVILCDRHTTERSGECCGFMLVYSGNHLEEFEKDQYGSTRVVCGIHPDGFSWQLLPGESFDTPEAILSCSSEGFNGLSYNYHRLIMDRVIPEYFRTADRPILINSWEAAYFNFDAEKIVKLAESAGELGIDMLVLDDGWFGKRDSDNSGLGDWFVNEKKLGCSMKELAERVNEKGLKFGLWFEPEMISEDSELFKAHPDWVLCDPDRKPVMSRNQMVLDMSRPEVVDYLTDCMCGILESANIEYIKWDFNRSVANVYSATCPPERQGEVGHRFMLGTYELLRRLRERFPALLIEGCSGGGGRFDAGMLFYCPQIWCSDDTDPIERLEIQRGTSYGYPVSAMGSHVSASPNHQTGRRTPFSTRSVVAQTGTFGYELDPASLSDREREEIREQLADCHRFHYMLRDGSYYRLGELDECGEYNAWMIVAPDKRMALVNLVVTHVRGNPAFPYLRLEGLDPEARYQLAGIRRDGVNIDPINAGPATSVVFTGAALMHGGISLPLMYGDYPSVQMYFTRVS